MIRYGPKYYGIPNKSADKKLRRFFKSNITGRNIIIKFDSLLQDRRPQFDSMPGDELDNWLLGWESKRKTELMENLPHFKSKILSFYS